MDTLFQYACAIHGRASPLRITEHHEVRSSWQDEDCLTQSVAISYHFEDGAVVRRTVEQDEWPDDNACAECWITYDVLRHADAAPIRPPHRHFDNACRERRWLGSVAVSSRPRRSQFLHEARREMRSLVG